MPGNAADEMGVNQVNGTEMYLAAAMCVSMAACGSKTDDTKTDGTGDADGL